MTSSKRYNMKDMQARMPLLTVKGIMPKRTQFSLRWFGSWSDTNLTRLKQSDCLSRSQCTRNNTSLLIKWSNRCRSSWIMIWSTASTKLSTNWISEMIIKSWLGSLKRPYSARWNYRKRLRWSSTIRRCNGIWMTASIWRATQGTPSKDSCSRFWGQKS